MSAPSSAAKKDKPASKSASSSTPAVDTSSTLTSSSKGGRSKGHTRENSSNGSSKSPPTSDTAASQGSTSNSNNGSSIENSRTGPPSTSLATASLGGSSLQMPVGSKDSASIAPIISPISAGGGANGPGAGTVPAGPVGFLELLDPGSVGILEKGLSKQKLTEMDTVSTSSSEKETKASSQKKKKRELVADMDEMQHKLMEMQFQIDALKAKNISLSQETDRWRKLWMMTVGAEPSVETSRQLQGSTACWAASIGGVSRLKCMLEYGGDVHQPDADGRTALHVAVAENQIETARFLLQSGAHIKRRDRWDDTPMSIAIRHGLDSHRDIAQLLEVSETTAAIKDLQSEYENGNYLPIGSEGSHMVGLPRIQKKLSKFFSKQPSPPTTMNAKSGSNPALYGLNVSSISSLSGSSPNLANRPSVRWSTDDRVSSASSAGQLASARGAAYHWNSSLSLVRDPSNPPTPATAPVKSPPPASRQLTQSNSEVDMFTGSGSRAGTSRASSNSAQSDEFWSASSGSRKSKDKKDKDKKRKSNKFLASLMRNLLRDSDETDSGGNSVSNSQASKPGSGKSKQTAAPFGVVHGVLRGACQVPDCDCKYFKKSANGSSTTCSCGHFPASHLNLGEADILEGLEHLKVVDEASIAVLVPKDPTGGPDSWPRTLNSHLQGDEDTEILSQMWASGSKGASAAPAAQWFIPASDLIFTRQIGSGTSATVYEGVYKDKIVAIKLISFKPSDKRPREKQRQELIEEFNVMTSIENQHVISFFGVVTVPRLCLVIEFCSRGSLYDVLSHGASADDPPPPANPVAGAPEVETPQPEPMEWSKVFRWFREAVDGVNALHQRKPPIVHRDLKSLNLLLNSDSVVKVADFGLSRFLSEEDNNQTTLAKLRGTYAYCSPEVYFGEFFSPKSDVYSLGVILWELITRLITGKYYRPYGDYAYIQFDFQIIIQAAKKFCRPTIPPETPAEVASMIRLLWAPKPESRPDCPTLLNMIKALEDSYSKNQEEWDKLVGAGAPLPPLRTAPNVANPPEWSMIQATPSSSSADEGSGSRSGSLSLSSETAFTQSGSSSHLAVSSKSQKRKSDHRPSRSRDVEQNSPRSGSGDNSSNPYPLAASGSSSNVLEASGRGSKVSKLLGTSTPQPANKTGERRLTDLMSDLNLFNEFKAYMATRYNSENLLFWEDVNKYRAMGEDTPEDKRVARATDIYQKYISGEKFDQQYVVSISPATTRDLARIFRKREGIDVNVFNTAFDEVEHVTLKPSFTEFNRLHSN